MILYCLSNDTTGFQMLTRNMRFVELGLKVLSARMWALVARQAAPNHQIKSMLRVLQSFILGIMSFMVGVTSLH